jgi:hypothetical protein
MRLDGAWVSCVGRVRRARRTWSTARPLGVAAHSFMYFSTGGKRMRAIFCSKMQKLSKSIVLASGLFSLICPRGETRHGENEAWTGDF